MKHNNKVFRYFLWKKNPQKNSNQLVDPATKPYPRTLMWKRPRTTAVEQHVPISLSLEIFSFSDKPLSQVAKHNWRSEALSEDKANICQSYRTDIQQTLSKNKHLFRVWCSLSFEPRFRSPTNPFEKVPLSLDAKCSTVFTRRMLTMCPLLLWASSKFVCYSLLQILSMKAVNVDRTSEVVGRKNQNNEPKDAKMWCDVII